MIDAGDAERLFRSIVESTDELEALRDRPDLGISSFAVNGPRVDVVAGDGVDEWRVVFFVPSPSAIESLKVFRRPAPMAVVPGGRAVVVNGPSSSGKSTLLREIARLTDTSWVTFDEPMFGSVDIEYLIWRARAEVLHRGFLAGIAALARSGVAVAVAAGGHPQSWFDDAFAGIPTVRVGLSAGLGELERRERTRNDIPGGWAAASLDVHDGWSYDLTFETDEITVDEVARHVLAAVEQLPTD